MALLALAEAHIGRTADSPVTNLNGMVTRSSSSDILAVFFRYMKLSWVLDRLLEEVYGSDEVDEGASRNSRSFDQFLAKRAPPSKARRVSLIPPHPLQRRHHSLHSFRDTVSMQSTRFLAANMLRQRAANSMVHNRIVPTLRMQPTRSLRLQATPKMRFPVPVCESL